MMPFMPSLGGSASARRLQRHHQRSGHMVNLPPTSEEQSTITRTGHEAIVEATTHALRLEIAALEAENHDLRSAPTANTTRVAAAAREPLTLSADEKKEEAEAQAEIEREVEANEVSFYFVRSSFLRQSTATTMPGFQELNEAGALVRRTFSRDSAYRAEYAETVLAVSHRWENPRAPDSQGAQLRAIQGHLASHETIELVWYDWTSMPQDMRTLEEREAGRPDTRTAGELLRFKHMLRSVNLLYLGCSVLVLCDMSYLSRFWVRFRPLDTRTHDFCAMIAG